MRLAHTLRLACALAALSTVAQAAPVITINPPFVDFGCIGVLQMGSQAVTVVNNGTTPLTIFSFQQLNANNGPFDVANSIPDGTMIAPGKAWSFTVTYSPMINGQDHDEIDLTTDDPMARNVKIPVDGCGAMASLRVDPLMLNFGSLVVGSTSPTQTITITNNGSLSVPISSVTLGGPSPNQFLLSPVAPFTLAPSTTHAVPVTCTPAMAGTFAATIIITPAGLPVTIVKLNCTGEGAKLEVSGQSALDFGDVPLGSESVPKLAGVTNAGSVPLTLASIVASNAAFILDTSGATLTLAAGVTSNMNIMFKPLALGKVNATITFNVANGGTLPVTISATGNGIAGAGNPGNPGTNGDGGDQIPLAYNGCCNVSGKGTTGDGVLIALALLPSLALVRRRRRVG